MKLEIGMYVRTNDGVFKIYAIAPKEENYYKLILEKNNNLSIGDSEFILNASHNIIDLIEVGDYVNGKEVTCVTENNYIELDYGCNMVGCNNEDIKTILTKEQFENNCYKIGDE